MKTIGCIGCGNMGGAVLKALASDSQNLRLLGFDHTRAKVDALNAAGNALSVEWVNSASELIAQSDCVIIAIKPQHLPSLYPDLRQNLTGSHLLVSLVAAVELDTLRRETGNICPIARIMPNLPAVIRKGVTALCLEDARLSDLQKDFLQRLFLPLGEVLLLPETKFSAFTAVAGCGPAYVDVFMEGMIQAAISLGFTAAQAKRMVAATVEGSAALALQSNLSIADLRIQVCSPAGVTIHAVNHLERTAVRGHVTDAVLAAFDRDNAMKK